MCEISQIMFSTKCEIFYFMRDYLMLISYFNSDTKYKFVLVGYEDNPTKFVALRSS